MLAGADRFRLDLAPSSGRRPGPLADDFSFSGFVPPLDGEALPGLIDRNSKDLGLSRAVVLQALRVMDDDLFIARYGVSLSDERLAWAARVTGVDEHRLRGTLLVDFVRGLLGDRPCGPSGAPSSRLKAPAIRAQISWCATCLKTTGTAWCWHSIGAVFGCGEHRSFLQVRCPHCGLSPWQAGRHVPGLHRVAEPGVCHRGKQGDKTKKCDAALTEVTDPMPAAFVAAAVDLEAVARTGTGLAWGTPVGLRDYFAFVQQLSAVLVHLGEPGLLADLAGDSTASRLWVETAAKRHARQPLVQRPFSVQEAAAVTVPAVLALRSSSPEDIVREAVTRFKARDDRTGWRRLATRFNFTEPLSSAWAGAIARGRLSRPTEIVVIDPCRLPVYAPDAWVSRTRGLSRTERAARRRLVALAVASLSVGGKREGFVDAARYLGLPPSAGGRAYSAASNAVHDPAEFWQSIVEIARAHAANKPPDLRARRAWLGDEIPFPAWRALTAGIPYAVGIRDGRHVQAALWLWIEWAGGEPADSPAWRRMRARCTRADTVMTIHDRFERWLPPRIAEAATSWAAQEMGTP